MLELALGTALVSFCVDILGRVGRGFVGTTALICAALMGVELGMTALMPDPGELLGSPLDAGAVATFAHWSVAFTAMLAASAFFCAVGTDIARRVVGAAAVAVGCVALGTAAAELGPGLGGAGSVLLALAPGTLLLGAALSGMLLGHWYLITPAMSFRPLRQSVYVVFLAIAVQLACVVAALLTSGEQARGALVGATYGVPFWLLVIGSGIVFTGAVNGLTLYFARIRANQPATAMLYALIVSVVMGVVPAHLLWLLTGAPV